MKRIIWGGLMLSATLLVACSDELDNGQRYDDGQLHLKLSFNNEQGRWAEGSEPTTRAMSAIPMTADGMEGLTLYLHCEEQDYIDEPVTTTEEQYTTRGQRITGEAFEEDKLPSFGLYARIENGTTTNSRVYFGTNVNNPFVKQNRSDYSDDPVEGYYESNDEVELDFPGNNNSRWPDNQNVTFYAYAPHKSDAPNITADALSANNVPSITYTMQTNEADNKDILVAQKTVNREQKNTEGVKLQFRHILSAVKFKGTIFDGFQAKVTGEDITYTLKVTQIRVNGIYKSGKVEVGKPFDGELTSYWSVTTTGTNATGYCDVTDIDDESNLINSDEHCLMLLPQSVPTTATLKFKCDVYDDNNNLIQSGMEIQAPLKYNNGDPLVWLPGHSYTYTINDTDLVRYMSISTPTNGLKFPLVNGEDEDATWKSIQTITIKSYFTNPAPGNQAVGIPAPWHPQYSYDRETWVDGLPQGYLLYDGDDNPILDLENIPGSVAGTTYKLEALTRSENSPTINTLQTNKTGGYGMANEPVDLSLYNTRVSGVTAGQAWPTGRNTANCYIINGYGYFKFPLVYGNAIKNGTTNLWAFTEHDQYKVFVNYNDDPVTDPNILTDIHKTINDVEPFLVWQDEKDVVKLSPTLTQENGLTFINFSIPKGTIKSGNALIAIRETGTKHIIWSWHIWIFDGEYDDVVNVSNSAGTHSLDFTKYHIGWRIPEEVTYQPKTTFIRIAQNGSSNLNAYSEEAAAEQEGGTVTISGSNLYYQHGRKDPLPACYRKQNTGRHTTYSTRDMTIDIYKMGYCRSWWTSDGHIQGGGAPATMGTAIQTPYYLYSTGARDWMKSTAGARATHEYSGRWDPEKGGNYGTGHEMTSSEYSSATYPPSAYSHIKTIYDPCPYGYSVPPCNAYGLLLFEWMTGVTNTTIKGLAVKTITGPSGSSLDFPASGWRIAGSNGTVSNFNSHGYCWTAGVQDGGDNQAWYLETDGTHTWIHAYCRNHTSPIRATRDNEYDRISKLPFVIQDGLVTPESSLSRRK